MILEFLLVTFLSMSNGHGLSKIYDENVEKEAFLTNNSFNFYSINRIEVTSSNCNKIFTFKYDSTDKLDLVSFNDEDIYSENLKYKQVVAVKNNFKLILLLFYEIIDNNNNNNDNKNEVLFKEYLIWVII